MTTVVIEGQAETEGAPIVEAETAEEVAEEQTEAVEAVAEAAVEIAEIEADRDITIAESNNETAVEVAEVHATAEERLAECQTMISALTTEVGTLRERLEALSTPVQLESQQPSEEHVSGEVTPDSQEAPLAAPVRRPRHRWT